MKSTPCELYMASHDIILTNATNPPFVIYEEKCDSSGTAENQ